MVVFSVKCHFLESQQYFLVRIPEPMLFLLFSSYFHHFPETRGIVCLEGIESLFYIGKIPISFDAGKCPYFLHIFDDGIIIGIETHHLCHSDKRHGRIVLDIELVIQFKGGDIALVSFFVVLPHTINVSERAIGGIYAIDVMILFRYLTLLQTSFQGR